MQKLFLLLLFALCFGINVTKAQENYDSDTQKYIEITFKGGFDNIILQMGSKLTDSEFQEYLPEANASVDLLYKSMVPIYQSIFTHSEILEMLESLNTPIVQKMVKYQDQIQQNTGEIVAEWANQLIMIAKDISKK